MSVQRIQLDRLSQKFANLVNKGSPEINPGPSMATYTQNSYAAVVKQPARPQVWRSKDPFYPVESRSRIVCCKLDELHAKSTISNPICLRCGSAGHRAADCRNAQLCFICNKFGHKAIICRSSTSIYPSTPHKRAERKVPQTLETNSSSPVLAPSALPVDNPASPLIDPPPLPAPIPMAQIRTNTRAQVITAARASNPPFRAPVQIFTPSPMAEAAEQEFKQSFILDDVAAWGPDEMARVLHRLFDQYKWRVAVFDEFRYLIKAPSMAWKQATAKRGYLTLDGVKFPVVGWDPSLNDSKRLTSMWLRIRGFDRYRWDWVEFDRLLNPFGAVVLELDPATRNKYDYRFARVRVGACDPAFFTEKHWSLVRNMAGYVTSFDLDIEVETEHTELMNAWLTRIPNFAAPQPPRGPIHPVRRAPPPPVVPPRLMILQWMKIYLKDLMSN